MALALDLVDVDATTLLGVVPEIVGAVSAIAGGRPIRVGRNRRWTRSAVGVARTIDAGQGVLADAREALTVDEIVSNTGVLLFGGIETTEGMTANLFAHLLAEPDLWRRLHADRSLIANSDRGVAATRAIGSAWIVSRPAIHARGAPPSHVATS